MPNRTEFQNIAKTRLAEARVLHKNKHYDGAYYLAGYVLECALKARICKILQSSYPEKRDKFGSFFTHDFDVLIKLAGLETKLSAKLKNTTFATNWSLITDKTAVGWKETARYNTIGTKSRTDVENIFNALVNTKSGILTWIKTLW